MLRARWVTLRARWVTLRARWVTTEQEVVNALLELGADFNYKMDGRAGEAGNLSALTLAAHQLKLSSVKGILTQVYGGLDGEVNGYSALSTAAMEGDVTTATALVQCGCKANREGSDGNTPLMHAVLAGMPATVAALVR
jgi:ankyrin repeat protein